jgi:hypothetical protein
VQQPSVDDRLVRGVLLSDDTRLIVTLPNLRIGRELQFAEERRVAHVEVGINEVVEIATVALLPHRHVYPPHPLIGPDAATTPFAVPNCPPVRSILSSGWAVDPPCGC